MDATEQNYRIADQILILLAKENCTILQASGILTFVQNQIRARSTVQYCAGELANIVDSIN